MAPRPIRLLVGLGNPGDKYRQTRHNAGFWLLDSVAARLSVSFKEEKRFQGLVAQAGASGGVRLLKPSTFMNNSGRAVAAVASYFDIAPDEILIAHDEIDLPPGTVRLKRGGGHGGHNGLRDIIPALGSADFYRLRIGVGHPGTREQVIGYVLARAPAAEQTLIDQCLERALSCMDDWLAGRHERAMNELHRRDA